MPVRPTSGEPRPIHEKLRLKRLQPDYKDPEFYQGTEGFRQNPKN